MNHEKGKLVIGDKEWFSHSCVEVTDDFEKVEIAKALNDALDKYPTAAGLAANQLGYNKRMAIIVRNNGERMLLVNPIVIDRSSKTDIDTEGCLSFPKKKVKVRRNCTITVKITPDSEPELFIDWEARVLQHELAHLDGQTMWDYSANKNRGSKFTPSKKKRKKRR